MFYFGPNDPYLPGQRDATQRAASGLLRKICPAQKVKKGAQSQMIRHGTGAASRTKFNTPLVGLHAVTPHAQWQLVVGQ